MTTSHHHAPPDVLHRTPLPDGTSLALLHDEEMLWIEQCGSSVSGCFWRLVEMEKAVRKYRHLGRALRPTATSDN